jgi:hypothetical protein
MIYITGFWVVKKSLPLKEQANYIKSFIIYSIVAFVVLTVVLNVLPLVFPNAAAKVQKKIEENARRAIEQHKDTSRSRVKVFFPWKVMLIGSIVLTLVVNIIGLLAC